LLFSIKVIPIKVINWTKQTAVSSNGVILEKSRSCYAFNG
jgi:hypothetical protein